MDGTHDNAKVVVLCPKALCAGGSPTSLPWGLEMGCLKHCGSRVGRVPVIKVVDLGGGLGWMADGGRMVGEAHARPNILAGQEWATAEDHTHDFTLRRCAICHHGRRLSS